MATAKNNRRNFIWAGLSVVGATVLGFFNKKEIKPGEGETVRMMTPEGKVVEVEKRHLSKLSGKAVSNTDLKAWMEVNKKGI